METDDDIRYTVLGLKLMEEKGTDGPRWMWDIGWANLPMRWYARRKSRRI